MPRSLDHRRDQRLPVRKILIEVADRDTGAFGDAGGGEFAIAHGEQNLNAGLEERRHRRFRTRLNRALSGLERVLRLRRDECEFLKREGSCSPAAPDNGSR
jgi:hypothetical protein